jgi:glycosyltransferase involved in cell wall biosynthesis
MAEVLKASKIVVLPILKESIAASGSSTCLNAMLFNRCVIGTEGPGFSDVFENGELVCVPPENPGELARAIQDIWSNDDKRRKIASAGHKYALQAGDLQALFQRLIDSVGNWYTSTKHV